MAFAGSANSVFSGFKATSSEFDGYFILWQNSSGQAPTRADCRNAKNQYGLTDMPVLYDKQGRLRSVGLASQHWHYVIDAEGKVAFKQQFNDSGFRTKVTELLSQ